MSIISVVLLAGALLFAGCVVLLAKYHQQKQNQRKGLLRRLSRLGSQQALRFSSQERLPGCLIGLDGISRNLLVLRHDDNGNMLQWNVIHLWEVSRCSVQKEYSKEGKLLHVALQFERDGRPPFLVPFYQHTGHYPPEAAKLEQRAYDWQVMLSKMLKRAVRKTA